MNAVLPSLHFADYGAMVMYFAAMAYMGWRCSGDTRTSRGFLLGGGNMPTFALAISGLMAALSAFSLVMVPGEIFNHGLSMWVFGPLAPLFNILTCVIFMRFYFRIGAFTPFEYLERRYDRNVRTLIAVLTIYLRIIYLGMVMFSTSKVFEGAAGWPAWQTITLCGAVSMIFTAKGGLKAVVWSDVMQFVILVGGLAGILGMLFHKIDGGALAAVAYPFEHGRGLDAFAKPEFYSINPYARLSFWLLLLWPILGTVTAMASDQMTVQRLLASGSYRNAVRTQVMNTCISIPMTLTLWLIGLSVFTFFSQNPELKVASGDTALFTFIATQMPTPLPGLVIAAMFAAVISTLNAVYAGMATIWLKEVHIRYFAPDLPEISQVRVSRIATLAMGAISIAMGLFITLSADWLGQAVVEAQTIFYAFDAIVIPAFLFAAFSRRASVPLVWITAGLLWGLKLAVVAWYSLSTRALLAVGTDGLDISWAGPIPPWYALPFVAAAAAILIWRTRRRDWARGGAISLVAACMFAGYAMGVVLWSAMSAWGAADEPRALSFQWVGFPAFVFYMVFGGLWLCFGKVQPPEKWRGLTMFSKDDPAASPEKNAK